MFLMALLRPCGEASYMRVSSSQTLAHDKSVYGCLKSLLKYMKINILELPNRHER